jgi:hypothetical protein
MHARSISVENSCDLNFETMLSMVIEEQSLSTAFSLIIAGPRTDRIDVAPVFLGLRMDNGITINLAGRGLENTTFKPLGEPEHVDRSVHGSLGRLHWIMLIVDRRSRASEIVDLVRLDVERERHVMADELEAGMSMEMLQVTLGAGEKIVDAEYIVSLLQQAIDQVGPKEPRAARDENAFAAVIEAWHAFIS